MPLPPALLTSLENIKGFNRAAFEAVHASGEQVTSIRLNPLKAAMADDTLSVLQNAATAGSIPWCVHGRYLSERPSFTLDPVFHAGAYYVQEASSMFLWHVLTQTAGDAQNMKVLDLCAAPGGKSTLLASYFTEGLLVSNEVIRTRASVLVENITKWGAGNVVVTNNDPSHFQSLPAYFDVMLVDAPCSGSGLFRKDPDAIAEWSADNVQLCSQRQQRILADALPALKMDGLLIYATCSYSVEEDEAIADWLVTELDMESIPLYIEDDWGIIENLSPLAGAFSYRFYPDKVKGEGFFIAAFRKKTEADQLRLKQQHLVLPSKQEWQQIKDFMPALEHHAFFKQADGFRTVKEEWLEDIKILAQCLYLKKAGTAIGSIKGKDMIPAHELALGLLPLDHFPSVELDKEQALQYLRRKDIQVTAPKGWSLVRHNGFPLGWIKVLPNRINNYYPAEWRILKD